MGIIKELKSTIQKSVLECFQKEVTHEALLITETKPEFEGDYTLVTFALAKELGKKPDEIALALGEHLLANDKRFISYNVIKGFLNFSLDEEIFKHFLSDHWQNHSFGQSIPNQRKVMIEYSSPNTNKPIHFGHLRNNFLGYSVANLLKASGNEVIKTNLINDRGIHICKSMIAWQLFANGATPESTGIKGDHLVGDYYVKFNEEYKKQITELIEAGSSKEVAEKEAPIMKAAQGMLRKWESGDQETINLWTTMNAWVYKGFDETYQRLGIDFDKVYYESKTYLLGKEMIQSGLESGVLYRKDDDSVWIDLTEEGLDHKLLLRGDGTAVYITQDIGTANLKYRDYVMDSSVYVIGDEQNYHMQVLKLIMQKLGEKGADGIFHLSYGMVELPSGKMKSREGNVVDADDMVDEMIALAKKNTEELGKVDGFTQIELDSLFKTLGLGALKFYLLRVDPKKRMIFNPQESIDFQGFTGPFIQYTHARICSILRKAEHVGTFNSKNVQLTAIERSVIQYLEQFPDTILIAAKEMNPSILCNYIYQVAKNFNAFLVDHSILKAASEDLKNMRLQLAGLTKHVIADGLKILGINAPERM